MIAFGHTAIGAVVGLYTYQLIGDSDPLKGLITAGSVGVISHYIADFIPHGHFFRPKDNKKWLTIVIIFDLFLSLAIFSGLAHLKFGLSLELLYVLFGIGGSQLPDVVNGLVSVGSLPNKGIFRLEDRFHNNVIHWHGFKNNALLWSKTDIWQVSVVIISLILILWF